MNKNRLIVLVVGIALIVSGLIWFKVDHTISHEIKACKARHGHVHVIKKHGKVVGIRCDKHWLLDK